MKKIDSFYMLAYFARLLTYLLTLLSHLLYTLTSAIIISSKADDHAFITHAISD